MATLYVVEKFYFAVAKYSEHYVFAIFCQRVVNTPLDFLFCTAASITAIYLIFTAQFTEKTAPLFECENKKGDFAV